MGQSLSDFGKAVQLLGACEENSLGKAFSELGAKAEMLSIKLEKEVLPCFCILLIMLGGCMLKLFE